MKLERVTKFGTQERGNANLGTRKKSFEKARGNAERKEEMKECRHASREGPAEERAPSSDYNASSTNIISIITLHQPTLYQL